MDGKLPSLFRRLPRLPYGVEPVPAHLAPKYTGGRYVRPRGHPRRDVLGQHLRLESRPLYVLEALTLHEAVPGHHLQIACAGARGAASLPALRLRGSLRRRVGALLRAAGLEAGFYRDPYANFGRLTYEMWRACRLVVDTGLHAKGWRGQQAIDYLAPNTALSLHEVATEIDRYISWPGQALAYKMGELKIRELRAKAEAGARTALRPARLPRRRPRQRRRAARRRWRSRSRVHRGRGPLTRGRHRAKRRQPAWG